MDSLEWLEKSINERHINFYDYDEFINKEKTNEGGFGTIQKAEWKGYGLTVALKSLKVNKNLDKLVKELQLLRSVSLHPNINLLYGLTKDPIDEHYVLILQFANEGNLREYLRKNFKELKWTDKYRIGKEISQGLLFLHNNNIVHRDLHSKNILVHERKMMIADFGLSQNINDDVQTSNRSIHGMPAYIDPQCFRNSSYIRDKKSDIYSLGVIFWEISSGRPPFQSFTSREAIVIHIFRGSREIPVEDTPQKYLELYTKCWDEIPNNRPEIKQVYDTLNSWVPESVSSTINTENSLKGLLDNAISQHQINNIQYSEFTVPISIRNFSSTYKSEWDRVKLTVVFKTLRFGSTFDENTIQDSLKQFKILQRASFHQNIIHLYGVTKNEEGNYMSVLQYANHGNLREYFNPNYSKLEWKDKFRIAMEVANGLTFLHNLDIIHQDLNSTNILVHDKKAKIAGLVKQTAIETSGSHSMADRMTEYVDPQCFKEHTYKRNQKSDIYSLGVIFWEISSGKKPFSSLRSKEEIAIHIFKGVREEPIEHTPPEYIKLYQQCWDDDPLKRPEMMTILKTLKSLNHPESTNHRKGTEKHLNRLLEKATFEQNLAYFNSFEFDGSTKITKELHKFSWKSYGKTVILKCLKANDKSLKENIIREFINKLEILQKITFHSNVINFYGITKDSNGHYNTVLQFVGNTNLRDHLNHNNSKLSWDEKFNMAKEIVEGIEFLHKNNIAHCNLHYGNVLVYEGKMIIAGFDLLEQENQKVYPYIEPQYLKDTSYKRDMRSDIYSLGVILWEISSNRPPFPSSHSVKLGGSASISKRIFKGERETPIEGTPPRYIQLYKQCWDNEPTRRPGISLILNTLTNIIHPTIK